MVRAGFRLKSSTSFIYLSIYSTGCLTFTVFFIEDITYIALFNTNKLHPLQYVTFSKKMSTLL